jgi:hypothetical protein
LIVAEGGDKKPFAFRVHAKVIKATLNTWQGYGLDQP